MKKIQLVLIKLLTKGHLVYVIYVTYYKVITFKVSTNTLLKEVKW
jgi:hypothetical protein